MKKFKVLRTPMRMADVSFDDFYDEDEATNLRAERLRTKAVRRFRQQEQAA